MRALVFAALFFGLAVLLAEGRSVFRATDTVSFRDERGTATWIHGMTVFDTPPKADGILVEGAGGPEPLLPDGSGVTIVTGWATWCGHCRRELPELLALRRETGVSVRAVSVEPRDSLAAIEGYFRRAGLALLSPLRDDTGELAALLGGRAVPSSLVVDRWGQVVGRFVGRGPWASPKARAWLKALAAAASPEESRALHRDFTS